MIILCVLACLAVVTTMALCNLQAALRGRAATRDQLCLRQAELMCRAGIERVRSRLESSQLESTVPGIEEPWQPQLTGSSRMQCVVTTVAERDEAQQLWHLRATARVVDPSQPQQAYQRSEEIYLPLTHSRNGKLEKE